MKLYKRFFIVLSAVICVLFTYPSCKSSSTGPAGSDTTSHNFEWTIDTLKPPETSQLIIEQIVAINETEVWAAGHCDDSRYSIWFWNGQKWDIKYPGAYSTAPSYFDILIDFDQNIWFVGNGVVYSNNTLYWSDFIIKKEGGSWIKLPELGQKYCKVITQNKSGRISVACDSGIVVNFTDSGFQKEWVGFDVQPLDLWIGDFSNYIMIAVEEKSQDYMLLMKTDSTWKIKDKINLTKDNILRWKFGSALWGPDTSNLYSAGPAGIYKYGNNDWKEEVFNKPFQEIYGSDINNIFAGTVFGDVYHFNGSTWKKDEMISSLLQNGINGIWCNKDYVFIATSDGFNSYIARGVRK